MWDEINCVYRAVGCGPCVEVGCVASAADYHAVLISWLDQGESAVSLHRQVVNWIS